jgi:transcription antitermination factor NusG
MKILKFNTFINESNDPSEGIKQECELILSDFSDLGTGQLNIKSSRGHDGRHSLGIEFLNFSSNEIKSLLNSIDHLNNYLNSEGYFIDEIRRTLKKGKESYTVYEDTEDIKSAILLGSPYLFLVYKYKEEKTSEKIVIDIEVGDTVYLGKFKNKKTVIKKIDKDETGMPTINGKKVVTFRIQEPKKNPNFKGYRSRFKKKKKED